ncbi:MAG: 3-phosphoshikimate 1-carboxyvinyltransferase [Clostridia bacterium]|nr:3-phosphoshikimate 1-carboxyvinyltransferase [Clostridia bacterium]
MRIVVQPSRSLQGELRPPGDKSISHRAAIIAALAEGTSTINGFLEGADCLSTLACLRSLGVKIRAPEAGQLEVAGQGLFSLQEPETVLDAGNSGTTMRLLLGVLAGQKFYSVLSGDASLRRRPMGRVSNPLKAMGARIWGRRGGELAPLSILGSKLQAINYSLPVASAQVKSALLLAGLYAAGETVLREPWQSRDHSERMLRAAGAAIQVEGQVTRLRGGKPLKPLNVVIPGDMSAAAFFIVAAVILPCAELIVRQVNLNPTRTGILEVLRAMGALIEVISRGKNGMEPVGDIRVCASKLRGVEIGGSIIPRLIDEVPVLAVAAALAEGETVIRDAAELKVKESDRISMVARELAKMGAQIKPAPDGLLINGSTLRGAVVDSHGDHRLAMALAVAGLAAVEGETVIRGAECLAVSYPNFINDLRSMGVEVREEIE